MGEVNYDNAEGTFSVSYRKALSHHMQSSHFHSTYEVYYLLSGSREFFIKDRTMVVGEGDVVIIPPNILHRTTNAAMPRHERLVVNIDEGLMAVNGAYKSILQPLFDYEYVIIRCPPYVRSSIEAISRGIIQEMQDRRPGFEMYAQALVLQLLILCCRYAGQVHPERLEAPSPMHERISEVVHYINQHYMQELSLHGVAERFYTSPYYLSRFFKVATGFTFVEYVNSVRIKEAKKLLEQTTWKVHLIAKKVGFGSVTHFGRVFKSVTGHAPLYYRKGR